MDPLRMHRGLAAVLDRVNVDTDQIIPKQFLKRIERTGFGKFLFYDWRFLEDKTLNPDFDLNLERFDGASILLTGSNFGCGSSREHAAWALQGYGFRVLISSSFADIFFNNCFKNGILPIVLDEEVVEQLKDVVLGTWGYQLKIDLQSQTIYGDSGLSFRFEINPFRKKCLLNGIDDIGLTLEIEHEIRKHELRRFPFLR